VRQSDTFVDEHWVSTDSPEILNEAKRLGAQAILRPEELAQDNTPSSAAIAHAIHIIHSSSNTGLYANSAHKFFRICRQNHIVEIMCTSPFKTSQDVDNVIKKLHEN
jgi:CMP-N-acetylneuraminic acid synthetase